MTPDKIVSAGVRRLLAPNPGPMTLTGTNTYVLDAHDEPGGVIVVDPGPDDAEHLNRIVAAGPVRLIVTTHRHFDHTDAVAPLAERTGAAVRLAADFTDGERITRDLTVLRTPGHTDDSVCFRWREAAVLTGDTILGQGTTVVAHPDGDLRDYLASLERLAALGSGSKSGHVPAEPAAGSRLPRTPTSKQTPRPDQATGSGETASPLAVLPGHGPDLPDLAAVARAYLDHRQARLEQVRRVLAELGMSAREASVDVVVARVYADVDPSVLPAAEQSLRAQLAYLAADADDPKRVTVERTGDESTTHHQISRDKTNEDHPVGQDADPEGRGG